MYFDSKTERNAMNYQYIVVGYKSTYFVKNHSESKTKYTEDDIVRMSKFLIDNIFVECGGHWGSHGQIFFIFI